MHHLYFGLLYLFEYDEFGFGCVGFLQVGVGMVRSTLEYQLKPTHERQKEEKDEARWDIPSLYLIFPKSNIFKIPHSCQSCMFPILRGRV